MGRGGGGECTTTAAATGRGTGVAVVLAGGRPLRTATEAHDAGKVDAIKEGRWRREVLGLLSAAQYQPAPQDIQ